MNTKKKKKSTSSTIDYYLPQELLCEVLKRVPAKSLLKLRSVCKTWNSIICDTNFAQLHVQQFRSNSKYLLSYEHRFGPRLFVRSSETFNVTRNFSSDKFLQGIKTWPIVGHVDGVLLIHHISMVSVNKGTNVILLWNPTIGKLVEVPPYKSFNKSRNVNFGFGFDPVSRDYKVVAVNLKYYKSKTKVYHLGSRSWAPPKEKNVSIDNVLYLPKCSRSLNFEGGIYWLASLNKKKVIYNLNLTHCLCFNLSNEAFTYFELPDTRPEQRWRRLSILHDSLALVDYFVSGSANIRHLCVWARPKDATNSKDSWIVHYNLDFERKTPLFMNVNGDFYLRSWSKTIHVYDSETQTEKYKMADWAAENKPSRSFVDNYTQSLILLGQPQASLVGLRILLSETVS